MNKKSDEYSDPIIVCANCDGDGMLCSCHPLKWSVEMVKQVYNDADMLLSKIKPFPPQAE